MAPPLTVDLFPGCLAAKNAVLARADDSNAVVGAAFAKNVAKPAANATVNVGALTFAAPSVTTFHATNLPGDRRGDAGPDVARARGCAGAEDEPIVPVGAQGQDV